MPRKRYYRALFLVSAAWNLLLAGGGLLVQYSQLTAVGTELYLGWQFPVGYMYFVFLFGFGYYLVARDIDNNHGIVTMGILGKLGVFAIFIIDFHWGAGNISQTLIGGVDLLFAFLFIEFLYTYARGQVTTEEEMASHVQKGHLESFDSFSELQASVGGKPILSKLGLIQKAEGTLIILFSFPLDSGLLTFNCSLNMLTCS